VHALLTGLGIGLAAGISPGPLLVLVVTSSLRGGLRHGIAVAAAPLVSDLVVVGLVLAVLGRIPPSWLSVLGLVGGLAVIVVGLLTVREGRAATLGLDRPADSRPAAVALARGSLVNLLSPHPWISWITVLGPLTVSAWRGRPASGVLLVAGFYLTLVGSKVAIAAAVSGGRHLLNDAGYRRAVVTAGAALILLGVVMLVEFGRTPG
jgi:threonine/homoserine/homoserine lactone efflux protein